MACLQKSESWKTDFVDPVRKEVSKTVEEVLTGWSVDSFSISLDWIILKGSVMAS